jgi:ketosteroid isomerase-like protein
MKTIQILFLISLLSCVSETSDQTANVEIIKAYVDAVENNDYSVMASYLSEDYKGIGPSVKDTTTKELALASWKTNSETLYEEIRYSKSRIFPITVTEGDYPGEWVTNFALVDITYKDGDKVQLLANTSYMINNGKIVRSFTFYNEADVLRQLNYVFIDLDEFRYDD